MPDTDHQPTSSDLEQRAAEVRRLRAKQKAEHAALDLALSVTCPDHNACRGDACYPPPASGVCGHRYARAVASAKSRRGQSRSQRPEALR